MFKQTYFAPATMTVAWRASLSQHGEQKEDDDRAGVKEDEYKGEGKGT